MAKILKFNFAESDIVDIYIRVKKKDIEDFKPGTIAITEFDETEGVFALVGITVGDENSAVQSYLFLKDMWTEQTASEWVFQSEKVGEPLNKKIIDGLLGIQGDLNAQFNKTDTKEKDYSDLMSIDGVEIFATGTHNGDKYTIADLKDIEQNFVKLKNTLQPYVKLGHNNEQELLQKDGLPAAGWLKHVYVKGEKLLADIIDMPKTIYELVKNRAYKRISSELYWNFKDSAGSIHKRALKAISLLGGDTPAVGSLSDIQALYSREIPKKQDAEIRVYQHELQENEAMNKEIELQEKLHAQNTELEALKAKNSELEKEYSSEQEAKQDVEKKYSVLQDDITKKEIASKVDKLIEDGKVLPAQKDHAIAMYAQQSELKKYSDTSEDVVDKFFEASTKAVDTKELTTNVEQKSGDEATSTKIKEASTYSDARQAYSEDKGAN